MTQSPRPRVSKWEVMRMGNIASLEKQIKSGAEDAKFLDIYADESKIEYQKERYVAALEKFKEIYGNAKVMIFDEPTRGIDVNSKAEIYTLMGDLLKEGKAILMISSDMPELISMSDRVIIVKDGAITGELDGQDITEQNIITKAL